MRRIVFLRHGQSKWNLKNDFTGWTDVDLTKRGIHQALVAGDILRAQGFVFDEAHCSLLRRVIHTLWIVLDRVDLMWIPIRRTWRLNERHYGALQGLDKKEMTEIFGEAQVKLWRRSWDKAPPPLKDRDERHPGHDPRYSTLPHKDVPATESLKDCSARVLPYWYDTIMPALKEGKELLVVASGNSLRAIVKMLDNISDSEIPNINVPTGTPLVYELDEKNSYRPIKHYYLGNQEEIQKAIDAVKNQSKKPQKF